MKKVTESAEKSANTVFDAMVDRVGEHISQLEESTEKGKETVKKVGEIIKDGVDIVIEAAAEHFAGIVYDGEGIDLQKDRELAKDTFVKLCDKTGEYIEVVADAVSGGVEQVEETIEKDIEAAKEVKEELKDNFHSLKEK